MLAGAAAATAYAAPAPRVDPPQLVTGPSPLPADCSSAALEHFQSETEPSVAVSPRDSDTLVATWMQDASVAHPVARSADGGLSWHTVVPPGLTTCTGGQRAEGVFDPWVSYGIDGLLYLSSPAGAGAHPLTGLTDTYNPLSRDVWVHVSEDDGLTWREPVSAGGDDMNGFIVDKPTITGDSLRPGMAYLTWARVSPVGVAGLGFSRTTDGGHTWTPSRLPIYIPQARGVLFGSQIVVGRFGDLVLITGEAPAQVGALAGQFTGSTRFYAMRSTDFGASWSDAVLLGEAPQFPAVASVATAQDGTAYVTWTGVFADRSSAVYVISSADGGATWGRPVIAAAPPRVASNPAIAVDARGAVGLSWWEEQGALMGAVSYTRGRTWVPRALTAKLDTSRVPATNSAGGAPLGDYFGLVPLRVGFVSIASLPRPYAVHGPTDIYATRFGD